MIRNGIRIVIAAVCAASTPQASAESSGFTPLSATPPGWSDALRNAGRLKLASTVANTVEATRYREISVGARFGNTLLTADADSVPWPTPNPPAAGCSAGATAGRAAVTPASSAAPPKFVQARSSHWVTGSVDCGSRPNRGSVGCSWNTKKKPSGDAAVPPTASATDRLKPKNVMSGVSVPRKIGNRSSVSSSTRPLSPPSPAFALPAKITVFG